MFNPDAHSDCMKQMGRRDANDPPMQIPPHEYGTLICPACVKHEDDCWGKPCECLECQPHEKCRCGQSFATYDLLLDHIANGEQATGPHISIEASERIREEHFDGLAGTR